jgi:cytochrome c1
MCHLNEAIPQSQSVSFSVGPDLSAYGNDPIFLSRWLADPQGVRPSAQMPDLNLSDGEIEALIAFLNEDTDA